MSFLSCILEYIFPDYCLACEEPGDFLCAACRKNLKPHPELCPFCHRVSPHYARCLNCLTLYPDLHGIIIAFQYHGTLKQLIWKLKYNHRRQIAPFLAERLALLVQTHPELQQAIQHNNLLISSVPSHRRRKFFVKGYNQSQLLAQAVAEKIHTPYEKLFRKHKYTRSQAKLKRKDRLYNLSNSFSLTHHHRHSRNLYSLRNYLQNKQVKGEDRTKSCQESPKKISYAGKILLIIDDITTTGSTINELASVRKKSHPNTKVRGLVVGRHGK